jgi:hypothetical protein
MSNEQAEFRKKNVSDHLRDYHRCVGTINNGCRALEGVFKEMGRPLSWANQWVHRREGDSSGRVGVLFYDMLQNRQRWVSVPIEVFDSGEWVEFAKRYCRAGEAENGA